MFRKATKDTTLKLPRPVGEEGADTIPIAKGTMMVIDMVGLRKWMEVFSTRPFKLMNA
jgi:hypothetical protein